VDPDRIAAGGGSAGGHVAATTGICEGFDEEGEDLSVSARSNSLVLFNPVYDNGPEGYGHDRAKEWFPAISPLHNITEDDPSTIVFLGEKDKLIPVQTAQDFQYQQKRLGIHSELYTYKDQPHGFFNLSKGGPDIYKDTVLKADAFLVKLGYLSGKADMAFLEEIVKKHSAKKKKK
jgi:acetyl esterase/lipase